MTIASLTNVVVQLTPTDFDRIKLTPGLGRSFFTTFITAVPQLVYDLAGNFMLTIYNSDALIVTTFVPLYIPLAPVGVTLDVNSSTLGITYPDLIDLNTIYPRAVTFQSLADNASNRYTLSALSSVVKNSRFAVTIVISIDISDMNTMKSMYPLISRQSHTFISYASSLAKDWFGNQLLAINSSYAFEVTTFIPNFTPPQVTRYALDMNRGLIELTVSEAVDPMTTNLYDVNLQSLPSIRFAAFTNLVGAEVSAGSGSESNVVDIALSNTTLTFLKFNHIGNLLKTSYLTFSPGFISDYSGLGVNPAYDSSVFGNSYVSQAEYLTLLFECRWESSSSPYLHIGHHSSQFN